MVRVRFIKTFVMKIVSWLISLMTYPRMTLFGKSAIVFSRIKVPKSTNLSSVGAQIKKVR